MFCPAPEVVQLSVTPIPEVGVVVRLLVQADPCFLFIHVHMACVFLRIDDGQVNEVTGAIWTKKKQNKSVSIIFSDYKQTAEEVVFSRNPFLNSTKSAQLTGCNVSSYCFCKPQTCPG